MTNKSVKKNVKIEQNVCEDASTKKHVVDVLVCLAKQAAKQAPSMRYRPYLKLTQNCRISLHYQIVLSQLLAFGSCRIFIFPETGTQLRKSFWAYNFRSTLIYI